MGDALLFGDADRAGREVDDDVGAGADLGEDGREGLDAPVGPALWGAGVDVDDGGAFAGCPGGLLPDLAWCVGDGGALVARRQDAGQRGGDDGLGHSRPDGRLNWLGCTAFRLASN